MISILLVLLSFGLVSTFNCTGFSNTTCNSCVSNANCYWCAPSKTCAAKPTFLPSKSQCNGTWYAFHQCLVSGNILLYIVPILVGIGVISLFFLMFRFCSNYHKHEAQKRWTIEYNNREARRREKNNHVSRYVAERRSLPDRFRRYEEEHDYRKMNDFL